MRNPAYDLPSRDEIAAALAVPVDQPAEELLKRPAEPRLEMRWQLTKAPTVSEAHKAAIKEQRAYEVREADRSAERASRSTERGIERSNRK